MFALRSVPKSRREATIEGGMGLLGEQEALLDAWLRGDVSLDQRFEVTPRVVRIDARESVGGLAPAGSLVLIAWVRECGPTASLVDAIDQRDREGREDAQSTLRSVLREVEASSAPPSLAAVVTLRWGAHSVVSLPVDRRAGFALVAVPYDGGRLDVRGFVAEARAADPLEVEVAMLLRPPRLSPVEGETLRLLDPLTGKPRFLPQPVSFIGKIVKGIKDIGRGVEKGAKAVGNVAEKGAKAVGDGVEKGAKAVGDVAGKGAKAVGQGVEKGAKAVGDVAAKGAKAVDKAADKGVQKAADVVVKAAVDGKNVAKAGEEVAKGVGRAVANVGKAQVQAEDEGAQGVGPGAVDNIGAGPGDAADGAGDAEDVAEGVDAGAALLAGATPRASTFGATRGDYGLAPEPDVEALLAYRNGVLSQSTNARSRAPRRGSRGRSR